MSIPPACRFTAACEALHMSRTVLQGAPKSTQHLYRIARFWQPCRHHHDRGRQRAEEDYGWGAKAQWRGKPLQGEIVLSVTFYFKTKRRRDLDNQNKILFDALSGIVYVDDSQISELRLRREYDRARPRIEIQVQEAAAV
jgi:Holliday junction resolvase RusA-like endonuclease